MKIYSLTGFPSALTGSFTGSFFGDGSGLTGTDSGSWDGDFVGSAKITGSLSLSGSFKDQESSPGTAGQVLSSTVSGSQWVDAADSSAITGAGTTGTITKWTTGGEVIGNSIIEEAASAITVAGTVTSKDLNVVDAYANDPLIKLATNTSGNAEVQIRTATTTYNPGIGIVTSGYDFNIFTENTTRLTISSTGAATFKATTPSPVVSTPIVSIADSVNGVLGGIGAYAAVGYPLQIWGGTLEFKTGSSSNIATATTKLTISSGGDATFTGLINANQGVEVVDTTAGSVGTPNFKTILDYEFSNTNNRATIKGGNEATGTNGTYLKFYVNNLTTANSPLNLLTLQSSFNNGTNAQFDALIKANNGISFPTPSPASSGTVASSTLDAYEEGTWTPVIKFGTTVNSAGSVKAVYTRIGRVVYIQCTMTTITLAGTGSLSIEGLPYAVGAAFTFGDTQGNFRWGGIALSGAATHISGYFAAGQSKMAPQIIGTSGYISGVTNSGVSSTWDIYGISGFYMI